MQKLSNFSSTLIKHTITARNIPGTVQMNNGMKSTHSITPSNTELMKDLINQYDLAFTILTSNRGWLVVV